MKTLLLAALFLTSACSPKGDELVDAGLEGRPCDAPAADRCDGAGKAIIQCYAVPSADGGLNPDYRWQRHVYCGYRGQPYACAEGCPDTCNVTGICDTTRIPRCSDGCPEGWYCGDGTSCWQDGFCAVRQDAGEAASCYLSDGGAY